jgi:hypothetical protein
LNAVFLEWMGGAIAKMHVDRSWVCRMS